MEIGSLIPIQFPSPDLCIYTHAILIKIVYRDGYSSTPAGQFEFGFCSESGYLKKNAYTFEIEPPSWQILESVTSLEIVGGPSNLTSFFMKLTDVKSLLEVK